MSIFQVSGDFDAGLLGVFLIFCVISSVSVFLFLCLIADWPDGISIVFMCCCIYKVIAAEHRW